MADDAKPPTVEVHGKALQLSCAEWKRNQDGSWSSLGALLVGTETMDVTLRGAKETKVLEEKCGNGSTPSVTRRKATNQRDTQGTRIVLRRSPPSELSARRFDEPPRIQRKQKNKQTLAFSENHD